MLPMQMLAIAKMIICKGWPPPSLLCTYYLYSCCVYLFIGSVGAVRLQLPLLSVEYFITNSYITWRHFSESLNRRLCTSPRPPKLWRQNDLISISPSTMAIAALVRPFTQGYPSHLRVSPSSPVAILPIHGPCVFSPSHSI